MKIRYYLRGLGLGILVTAVFFLLGGNSGQTMSDEMIKERAKELGMVESTVLADIAESVQSTEKTIEDTIEETVAETTEEVTEVTTEEVSETETVSEEESTTVLEETTEEDTEEQTEENSSEEETTEAASEATAPTGQLITIVVNKGEGSDTVSHRLHEAGLIDDPYEYDRYLMQNGYDKRIAAGEHEIPMGAEWQEIAVLLTKR